MKSMTLMLVLLTCGCSAISKTEALIGKVSEKADHAITIAKEAKAGAEAAADEAFAKLEAKGAPVDGSASDLGDWAIKNPLEAASVPGALLTALAALAVGYRRKKAALVAVVKGVEDASDDAKANVKAAVADAGGSDPTIRATIAAIKKTI
jgi:hypothetical protein